MKSDRWRIVSPHLDQVLELPAGERRRFLARLARQDPALAADLELLLEEERALREEKYLEHDAQDLLAESHQVGQAFGSYAPVKPLGAGGMGSVWLAAAAVLTLVAVAAFYGTRLDHERDREHGAAHPDVAVSASELGRVLFDQGRLDEAETHFRAALAVARTSRGPRHPDVAQCLTDLAGVLRAEGKLAEAEAKSEEALAISRPALGRDHPAVSRQEVSLARIYLDQGRLADAQELLHHALAVQQRNDAASDGRLGITQSLPVRPPLTP